MPSESTQYGPLLSGRARASVHLDATLVDRRGRLRLDDFADVRRAAGALREAVSGASGLAAGTLGAVAYLDRATRHIVTLHLDKLGDSTLDELGQWLDEALDREALAAAVADFYGLFPAESEVDGPADLVAALRRDSASIVDIIAVWFLNENPAVGELRRLFDDSPLREGDWEAFITAIDRFFAGKPGPGGAETALFDFLAAPMREAPDSLEEQLAYIRRDWAHLLPESLREALLTSLDVLREENKGHAFAGPGPVEPPSFLGLGDDIERFSDERDWMADLVLIAKNAHVWLNQLSRRYERSITRLDEVPDEVLDELATRGISGLWLIGVWERSSASRRIKELSGNSNVASSAYSIDEYRIADDLGGESAWEDLRARATKRGIRMAADMVPNHMGITSRWVYEHPDRFLSVDQPPYDSYTFDGPDLSDDDSIGIFLEDHYYDHSDAAVVFKRVDRHSGQARYIYHGNDGTSMPWNDTAQLDYLNPETREAVIEQIVEVASRCSVIRFDAAMTLVKRHIRRLWYPEPGAGGAIPSRSERRISDEEFERRIPREFWTEVVDRLAEEAPDTLLLAEAFWMMEGYFVRSLGMHRVYNSAFMNMLSDEDNAGYRKVMKETLEFDPRILRRYVNFMNNPDEETAVAQFGTGDKYFGVCTMLATLPGLPMIGHGQIEGLAEKYGMDFKRPRTDERPDEGLVSEHRRRIFPLLRRRALFSGVKNFLLYDVYGDDGEVDEDVFAYSNGLGDERALVVYHNRYGDTRGWIRDSVAFRDRSVGEKGKLVKKRLAHGLEIEPDDDVFVTMRDAITGREYIRPSVELAERGMFVELGAYDCHVFVDFQTVRDGDERRHRELCERLEGRGVDSLDFELRHLRLEPLHDKIERLLGGAWIEAFTDGLADADTVEQARPALADFATRLAEFGREDSSDWYVGCAERALEVLLDFESYMETTPAITQADADESDLRPAWATLFAWAILRPIGGEAIDDHSGLYARSYFDEWSLVPVLADLFTARGLADDRAERAAEIVRFGVARQRWFTDDDFVELPPDAFFNELLDDPDARRLMGVNRHDDVLWFHHESFVDFMHWLTRFGALYAALDGETGEIAPPDALREKVAALLEASKGAEFRVEGVFEGL